MAKKHYEPIGGVARKIKKRYEPIGGIARKVKKGCVPVDGVAREFFVNEKLVSVFVKTTSKVTNDITVYANTATQNSPVYISASQTMEFFVPLNSELEIVGGELAFPQTSNVIEPVRTEESGHSIKFFYFIDESANGITIGISEG